MATDLAADVTDRVHETPLPDGPAGTLPSRRRRERGGVLRRWAEALVIAVLVVTFGATTVGIEGRSMEPTLRDGERALVPRYETWSVRFGLRAWERGDVVYFRAPGDTPRNVVEGLLGGPFVIKRVVAVGGEEIALEQGRLLVDGRPSDDPIAQAAPFGSFTMAPTRVPAGHVFVLGDNRMPLASRDSRAFGPVPVADVAGRAAWVIWPPLRRGSDGAWAWNVRRVPRRRVAASDPSAAPRARPVETERRRP